MVHFEMVSELLTNELVKKGWVSLLFGRNLFLAFGKVLSISIRNNVFKGLNTFG